MSTNNSPQSKYTYENPYTLREEIANSVTHGIGAGLSVVGLVLLVVLAAMEGDAWRIVGFSIYGASLIILYLASTLYHSFQNVRIKRVLQKVDHAAIFILIAGTYTPFLLISVRGALGYGMLALVWSIALGGIIFKAFFINRFEIMATLAYVAMGWLCVLIWNEFVANVPPAGVAWLMAGGIVYTAGVIFYAWRRLPYNHAIWHGFVLAGSACHFVSVFHLMPAA